MAHEVFISYSHKDKTTADAICNHLEARGMRCWYAPRDITPGVEWGNAILQGIEDAKIMVLVFTRDANLSQQVLREVNNAVNAGLSIIPFRLTEEEPVAGMRYYLSTVHWMDAMNEELEQAIAALGDLCQAVLEKKPVPSAAATPRVTPTAPKSKAKPILIAAIAVIAVAAIVIGILLATGKGGTGGDVNSAAPSDNGQNVSVAEYSGDNSRVEIGHDTSIDEVLMLGATADNVVDDPAETYIDGNNQCNILNGGYLAYDGEWYYYTSNDADCMYRMREDGSGKTKLTDIPAHGISVYDGYVYFLSTYDALYRMKTDGSDLTSLIEIGAEYARIQNGRIYYGDTGLYSIALDGSDQRDENDINGYYVVIDGIYTYYTDPNHGQHLYRARMDGSDAVCIYNKEVGGLRIAGKQLFFYERDSGWFSTYDLTTGEVTQLTYDPLNEAVVTKDGVYAWSGNAQLVFMPFEGFGLKVLNDAWASHPNVCGNKIFYRNSDEEAYYMMNLDGTGITKL